MFGIVKMEEFGVEDGQLGSLNKTEEGVWLFKDRRVRSRRCNHQYNDRKIWKWNQ